MKHQVHLGHIVNEMQYASGLIKYSCSYGSLFNVHSVRRIHTGKPATKQRTIRRRRGFQKGR
eukprot:scaffold62557_cov49-Prasinocladus_malaysianus.AAC.3